MSYTIEKLPDEAIILARANPDFIGAEGPKLVEDMFIQFENLSEKVYLISDMSAVTLTLDDVMEGSNMMTRGQKPVYAHHNLIGNVFVTSSAFLKLAAKGLSAPIFGGLQIKVVDTVDEALTYCRQKL